MAEVLKEWLTERLQRPIIWETEEFGNMMKNGHIIASVLLSYNIINDEKYFLIRSSNAIQDIKNNWKYLSIWLRDLHISLNDLDLNCIMDGKGSTILRLFYQLFLSLDKKDRTDFIKREKKNVSSLVEKLSNRFKVERVKEEEVSIVDDLSKPLLNEKHFVEWQRKKAAEIKETYEYVRNKYSKMLNKIEEANAPIHYRGASFQKETAKEIKEIERFSSKYPCQFKNYSYAELLHLENQALGRKKLIVDNEWAKNYMDNLYTKIHIKSDSEKFQKQISNELSGSLWEFSIAEEETKLDTELAKKVMKLSHFEKQMCTQIMETKQQARNLSKNRILAEAEFAAQREQQFNQFLDNVKQQIHIELTEIDFEKRRQNTLHKKLYAEKMKRKREHYYEICYDTMLSIVDYVAKYAYFKRLIGYEIPEHYIHEWKILYYKQQPIFDILEPLENLLKDRSLDEIVSNEVEEIVRLELIRQETLSDNEFREYHNYLYPWLLDLLIPNYDSESEERKYEYLGNRVLGHVVYTLLEIKYPYPPPRPPADLPDFSVKALLRGFPDRSMSVAIQILLNQRKIHVVRLETVINFCLRNFKTEMIGCTDIELSYDKFTAAALTDENKELIKLMKIDDDTANKISEANFISLGTIPPNAKQTQTPKTIPEEEIKLSTAADLGRYAYKALNFGDSLTDHLLAAMIVEYLRGQNNISGFVIINYPNSYREAQILEETFSGQSPPDEAILEDKDDIYLEETIEKHRKKEKDQYKDIRRSKLVNDPHTKVRDRPFQSYFTCYIQLKETEDILQEFVIWDLTEDNSEFIDRFYSVLGLNYSMYYEVIEKDFLAQICKYIIGDFVMPLKSCDKLFGENVLSLLDFPSSDDKRTKSKIVKPEVSNRKSKEKLRRISKLSKTSIIRKLEVVKSLNSLEEIHEDVIALLEEDDKAEVDTKSFNSEPDINIIAGEEDWNYGEIPIVQIIGVALATCWEEIERIYIQDLQQLFFSKRLQMNCLIPYGRFIKDKMEQIITMPNSKQDLVFKFQNEYNNFENDWRDINLTKNEWHCRVKELQNKLYHICDERKQYAELQRQSLIRENWTVEELTTMVNTFISCMQTELNRSILTFQILHDFYYAMIKRMPPSNRLVSKDLTKIFRESDETSGSKKGGDDKVYRQLKSTFEDMQLRNVEIDYSNNPFNMVIENNVKFALKVIKDTNDSYRSLISREYSDIAKIVPSVKKKDENSSIGSINAEEIFKQNSLKCIEEWTMAINGEMFRINLRLEALQYKCYRDMKLFNDHIYKTFLAVQNDINNYYLNEIKAVDRLCKYLQMAVEEGRRVPESLLLEQDTFVIDPNLLQYAPPEPKVDLGEDTETSSDIHFKITQLARLRSQYKIVAPNGIALQQAFIYLLQDFLFFGGESCDGPVLPKAWNRMDPEQIPKFVYNLFGETVYVDWRDFLIYCLNLRFPTVAELLALRNDFRCDDLQNSELIQRDDFLNKVFWFDEEFDPDDKCAQLRKTLIKHFIFELYETQENMMNYSAFLLAFCKSTDPIEGFVTALSMAVGKKICYILEECQEVVTHLINKKKYKDECMACALYCTHKFLDTLIVNVVNICEGITIVELEYTESPIDDKKGKKGKSSRTKKFESSQSARLPKSQKSLISRSKLAQSTADVQTTFICRPCEDLVDDHEEKLSEGVEEESKSEPKEDSNVAYAVRQSVIWKILEICLPWHFRSVSDEKTNIYVDQVKTLMTRLQTDTNNGDIYVFKFVTDPDICKLLHKVKKFTAISLVEEVNKLLT